MSDAAAAFTTVVQTADQGGVANLSSHAKLLLNIAHRKLHEQNHHR